MTAAGWWMVGVLVGLGAVVAAVFVVAGRIEAARAARWARIVGIVEGSAADVYRELDRVAVEGMRRLDPSWRDDQTADPGGSVDMIRVCRGPRSES